MEQDCRESSKESPKDFFDVGIAEQHVITMSAGMAKEGNDTCNTNIFIILSKSI